LSLPKSVYKKLPKRVPCSLGFSKYSLRFNKPDSTYVQVPDDATLDFDGALTVGCWFLAESTGVWHRVVSHDSDGDPRWLLNVGDDDHAGFYICDGTHGALDAYGDNAGIVTDGKWHFLVATCDGTDAYLYIDGEQAWTESGTVDAFDATAPLYVGRYSGGQYADGYIDEPFYFQRVLTGEEIREIMLNYHAISRDGLTGWWRMEEGRGTTVEDKSGEGNDGTMYNFADPYGWVEEEMWGLRAEVGLS